MKFWYSIILDKLVRFFPVLYTCCRITYRIYNYKQKNSFGYFFLKVKIFLICLLLLVVGPSTDMYIFGKAFICPFLRKRKKKISIDSSIFNTSTTFYTLHHMCCKGMLRWCRCMQHSQGRQIDLLLCRSIQIYVYINLQAGSFWDNLI